MFLNGRENVRPSEVKDINRALLDGPNDKRDKGGRAKG